MKSTVEVFESILSKNDKAAAKIRADFNARGLLAINLMSSPGAGKTTLLERTIKELGKKSVKIGVVEGDLETNKDADRIIGVGAKAHQITTGQSCHLDADMVKVGLDNLPLAELDLLFVENVGNLVCPASYDVGTHANVVLLSVPEGDDKIPKYPVMFRRSDLVIITKVSLIEYFDFSIERAKSELAKLNPLSKLIALDSKTGEGFEEWIEFIAEQKALLKK